jgi:uncharacterized delta-60 repeat protein
LARYNPGGSLDTTFGGDGKVTTDFTPTGESGRTVVLQPDGKIVVTGVAGLGGPNPRFALARYNSNGTLDATFSGDGKVTTDFTPGDDEGFGLVLQSDGKIVVAGEAGLGGPNSRFALARYTTNGSLDATFSGDGKVFTDFTPGADGSNRLVIQADQRVVAVGGADYARKNGKFAIARYNTNGSPDTTFSGDGKLITDFTPTWDYANGIAIQADNKLVVAGEAGYLGPNPRFALARYNSNGSPDMSFGSQGMVTTDFTPKEDFATGVEIQTDGGIVAAGAAGLGSTGSTGRMAIARYLAT